MGTFTKESTLPYSAATVFGWHEQPGAFERLNAPWKPVTVLHSSGGIGDGAEVAIKLPVIGPLGITWRLRHTDFVPGERFTDEQIQGPFSHWRHVHTVLPLDTTRCVLRDEIRYELPLIARPLTPLLTRELQRLFNYRHGVLSYDLSLHRRWRNEPRKSILISGSSGLVGSALTSFLSTAGHSVTKLVRRKPQSAAERSWDPTAGELSPTVFDGIDVVIHLGGESIATGRWDTAKKQRILTSRVTPTQLLCNTLAKLNTPPKVAIIASAVGFYGDRGDTQVDEATSAGSGFLADTSLQWEGAATPLKESKTRLVTLRIGTVLTARGGALQKMLPAFLAGVGGRLGHGEQFMSWISLQDLLGVIEHAIHSEPLHGAVNAVSPHPVTNSEFVRTLGRVLGRPTVFPVPAAMLRVLFGEMAEALLLASTRAVPSMLQKSGYSFLLSDLEAALRFECGRC